MPSTKDEYSDYFTVSRHNGVAIVRFEVRVILDAATLYEVSDDLLGLVDKHGLVNLIIDLGGVKFLTSRALGMLINLRRKATDAGGRIVIAGLAGDTTRVFKITKLDRFFDFYETTDQALQSFDVRD